MRLANSNARRGCDGGRWVCVAPRLPTAEIQSRRPLRIEAGSADGHASTSVNSRMVYLPAVSTSSRSLQRYIWVSICASLVIIVIKSGAYFVTGSVGLMSDALESIVNLISAIIALTMLKISARPPDQEHRYGHDKVEYFSSGAEAP